MKRPHPVTGVEIFTPACPGKYALAANRLKVRGIESETSGIGLEDYVLIQKQHAQEATVGGASMETDRFHSLFSRRFSPHSHLSLEHLSGSALAEVVAKRSKYVFHRYFSAERRLAPCFVIQE
jgi:hypothetical protein